DPGCRREVLRVEVDQEVPVHGPDVVDLLVEADERIERLRVLRPADSKDRLIAARVVLRRCRNRNGQHRRACRKCEQDSPHETAASSTSRVLLSASSRTFAPSGIVAMCLPWPTGTLA